MHWFRWHKNKKYFQKKLDELIPAQKSGAVFGSYEKDIEYLKKVFQDDDPIEFREITTGTDGDIRACLVFCDGLVDSAIMDNHLIRPLAELDRFPEGQPPVDALLSKVFQVEGVKKTTDYNKIIQGITYGDTLLLVGGISEGLLFSTKSFTARSVSEPEG